NTKGDMRSQLQNDEAERKTSKAKRQTPYLLAFGAFRFALRSSFRAQRGDRIQSRSAPRRIEAEKHTDDGRNSKGQCDGRGGARRGPIGQPGDTPRRDRATEDPD